MSSIIEIPHTISFFIRKMNQINSFDELQKEQRPPSYMWDNPDMLDEWFDIIFKRDKKDSSTNLNILIDEVE